MTKKNKNKKKTPIDPKIFEELDIAIEALSKAVDKLRETRNNICG